MMDIIDFYPRCSVLPQHRDIVVFKSPVACDFGSFTSGVFHMDGGQSHVYIGPYFAPGMVLEYDEFDYREKALTFPISMLRVTRHGDANF